LLAALPQQAPPTSRWPQIEAQLDARAIARPHAGARDTRRGSTRTWLAVAAGLCALSVLPFVGRMSDRSAERLVPVTVAAPSTTPSTIDMTTVAPQVIVDTAPPPSASAARVAITASVAPTPRARSARSRTAKIAVDAVPAAAQAPAGEETLESLYSASAQLETLLAMTRDTRVESGPAAALAGDFDAELALIDARLAEPGLDPAEQRTLWRARVDTLQDASSFEAHQRLLSAEGRRYEGALVSVD
jgi:hypothetical protein